MLLAWRWVADWQRGAVKVRRAARGPWVPPGAPPAWTTLPGTLGPAPPYTAYTTAVRYQHQPTDKIPACLTAKGKAEAEEGGRCWETSTLQAHSKELQAIARTRLLCHAANNNELHLAGNWAPGWKPEHRAELHFLEAG